MTPRAKKYGIRYYFDKEFRRVKKQREKSKKDRQKYGSGYLTSRKTIKRNLALQHGRICQWCKNRFSLSDLEIDHIKKRSEGGSNHYDNLQLLCHPCHVKKDSPHDAYSIATGWKPFEDLQTLIEEYKNDKNIK